MIAPATPKVVVLGMATKMPVAGVEWQVMHYLEGFRRLGLDPYYVEAHARTPSMFVGPESPDGADAAAAYLDSLMRRFGFAGHWAYHALHADGRCLGLSRGELDRLYGSAELIVNLHGGTYPLAEHTATNRLVFLGTDPVQLEVELFHGNEDTIRFLDAHFRHFTFGENYGNDDCLLPVTDRFELVPTRQPVVLDFWPEQASDSGYFTTVGNWRQAIRDLRYRGETYTWSKHDQFLTVLELPSRTEAPLELALASIDDPDRALLEGHGWSVRAAEPLSSDPDAYRRYVSESRGELTVAKDQNVRFRSGWFSDRSATYLAAGRPVVTQDTGFRSVLPTGRGLLDFDDLESAAEALNAVQADYPAHRAAAREIARGFFDHRVVLEPILRECGVRLPRGRAPERGEQGLAGTDQTSPSDAEIPLDLVLTPVSRHPTVLPEGTRRSIDRLAPARRPEVATRADTPGTSIVVLTHNQLTFTRLCIASVLTNTEGDFEVIVVDNASSDGTPAYLTELASADGRVQVVLNDDNRGFASGNNQGVARARGRTIVLLNNDTVVVPGWLARLERHLDAPGVGAVGPVTNRIGNEAEVDADYETYGELLRFASMRASGWEGAHFHIPTLTMFCFAIRKDVMDSVGPLDERFGLGTLEDDDYSLRLRKAGHELRCAEDVFVHHFGRTSFGEMVSGGSYDALLRRNRERFHQKWGEPWSPYAKRTSEAYAELAERIRSVVDDHLPETATVLVASRGDERLLDLGARTGWHLPQDHQGVYAGHYPGDGSAAIAHLEDLRARGGQFVVFPSTSYWWLDFYEGLRKHLDERYRRILDDEDTCAIYALEGAGS